MAEPPERGAPTGLLDRLRARARALKRETRALALAYRDPRTPWYARLALLLVLAYALSPLDLIPDVVPVLGYLDDLLLVPLGIALAVRLVPPTVMADCRAAAAHAEQQPPTALRRAGTLLIVGLWLATAALLALLVLRLVV